MGNAQSADASPPLRAPAPATVPPVPGEPAAQDDKKDAPSGLLATSPVGLRNPGTIEEMNNQCKSVFPTNFEGCRMIFNKGISSHFQISHTMNMSNLTPAGYRFGVTYVGTKMVGPGEAYPILLGDIDPSGNLNANIIHQITPRLKGKMVTQFEDKKCVAAQFTTDYKGDTYTASGTFVNIDVLNKSGIVVGHLLKNFTPKLDLGVEVAVHRSPQIPMGGATSIGLSGRYTSHEQNSVLSGSLQPGAAHLFYYKKLHENFQAGCELETNLAMGESTATVGYQIDVPKADLTFRGSVDSNWQVGAVLEKKLQPLPLTLTLSGSIDHGSKQPSYKFGCGLVIG